MDRFRKAVAALALALAVPAATAHELTIDLSRITGTVPDFTAVRVVLRSEAVGSGDPIFTSTPPGFPQARTIRPPASGRIVVDIPASSEFSSEQRYVLVVQARTLPFTMPARAATFLEVYGERPEGTGGLFVVDTTEPAATGKATGDRWFNPGNKEFRVFVAGEGWELVSAAAAAETAIPDGSITVQKLASGVVARFGEVADGAVTLPKLSTDVRNRYDDAVMVSTAVGSEQPSLSGHDLGFISVDGSTTRTVTLPGISIEDQGDPQGTVNAVRTIDFTGDGVTCEVVGTKSTCTVTGGVVDYADLTGRPDARFEELEEFEQTLRTSTPLVTNQAVDLTGTVNEWAAIGTVSLPATTPDRELVVTVEDVGEAALGRDRIDFDVLR